MHDLVRPPRLPAERPWQGIVDDPRLGRVRLSGALVEPAEARAIVLIVHGLGGHADTGYARRTAALAARRGLASLRLNLRGADRSGEDLYHAGLTADLRAALESPEVVRYPRRFVCGFSLGGHVTLKLAAESPELVDAAAAVCAPLDLDAGAAFIDAPARMIYRRHLLGRLRSMYEQVAARERLLGGDEPVRVRSIQTIREWDEAVVAPRYGFASAEAYYASESAGPRLGDIGCPALFLATEHDPMVAAPTLRPHLAGASRMLEIRWLDRGGHVGFPPRLQVEGRTLDWLLAA
jgi:predicted alpha/beta-fold hydrolase